MLDMQTVTTTRAAGPAPVPSDRRTRLRLRELCDEVLASYRLAEGRDLFDDADRRAARQLIDAIARRPA